MNSEKRIQPVENGVVVLAPAKINLTLLVAGKRPDGFHELETVMAAVDLFDEIHLKRTNRTGINIKCTGDFWAPESDDNLIVKAAEQFFALHPVEWGLDITLVKKIPAGSGLGSASSDAATTLLGLSYLTQDALAFEEIDKIAASLGSDVNFFLSDTLAFCTGRGEKIQPIDADLDRLALILWPNISVSTKEVYLNYTHDEQEYQTQKNEISPLLEKKKFDFLEKKCANMLAKSTFGLYKELLQFSILAEQVTRKLFCLSGSGSAMFSLYKREEEKTAQRHRELLEKELGCKSFLVRTSRR